MSQAMFDVFMNDQCAAIEASGLDPEQWITTHAASFRETWEQAHVIPVELH